MISATATAAYITVRAADRRASMSSSRVRSNWVGHSQVPWKDSDETGRMRPALVRRNAGAAGSGRDPVGRMSRVRRADTAPSRILARVPLIRPEGGRQSATHGGFIVRRTVAVLCALGLTAGLGSAPAAQAEKGKAKTQHLQVLAINDFHGNLEPPTGSSGRIPVSPTTNLNVGGAGYLATWLDKLREGRRHTLTVGAGDLIGA